MGLPFLRLNPNLMSLPLLSLALNRSLHLQLRVGMAISAALIGIKRRRSSCACLMTTALVLKYRNGSILVTMLLLTVTRNVLDEGSINTCIRFSLLSMFSS